MARHYAATLDNIVTDPSGINGPLGPGVILCDNIEWCQETYPDFEWIETYNENEPPTEKELAKDSSVLNCKTYAGIGHEVISVKDIPEFISPKPALYKSFVFSPDELAYIAPVKKPVVDEKVQAAIWDEKNLQFIVVAAKDAETVKATLDSVLAVAVEKP